MQTTQVIYFSPEQHILQNTIEEVCDLCERKGIEYKGPHSIPVMDESSLEANRSESDVFLFGQPPSQEELHAVKGRQIFAKQLRLHRYASDDVTRELVMREYPDELFVRINVNQSDFIEWTDGYAPFTYDPNVDYKTEP